MKITRGGFRPVAGCYAYIDGQYIRRELRNAGKSDEFNPAELAHNAIVHEQIASLGHVSVRRLFYYDAVDEKPDGEDNRKQAEVQREYLSWIQELDDTHVVEGKLRQGRTREQKGVDVSLAVDALRAAYQGVVDVIAIFAGDADFTPLVNAVRDAGPHVIIAAFRSNAASDLTAAADRVIYLDLEGAYFRFRAGAEETQEPPKPA